MLSLSDLPYSQADKGKLSLFFKRLLPHIKSDRMLITGGLALACHIRAPRRQLNDIDLVIYALNDIKPSITADFLISHFHDGIHNSSRFMVQLADPVTGMRCDIFPYLPSRETHTSKTGFLSFNKKLLKVLNAEILLVHLVRVIKEGLQQSKEIDPKYYASMRLLQRIVLDVSLISQIQQLEDVARIHTEYLKKQVYNTDTTLICRKCMSDKNFPIAPGEEIFKIWGYR